MKTEILILTTVILVTGGLICNMFTNQWEHAERHKGKTSVVDNGLAIQLLEELVKKEPDNYQAWRELGKLYRNSFDFVKARKSWGKSLELAPAGENADKIKKMIDHMENGHGSTSHNRHKRGP